jgi:hypothetical protein
MYGWGRMSSPSGSARAAGNGSRAAAVPAGGVLREPRWYTGAGHGRRLPTILGSARWRAAAAMGTAARVPQLRSWQPRSLLDAAAARGYRARPMLPDAALPLSQFELSARYSKLGCDGAAPLQQPAILRRTRWIRQQATCKRTGRLPGPAARWWPRAPAAAHPRVPASACASLLQLRSCLSALPAAAPSNQPQLGIGAPSGRRMQLAQAAMMARGAPLPCRSCSPPCCRPLSLHGGATHLDMSCATRRTLQRVRAKPGHIPLGLKHGLCAPLCAWQARHQRHTCHRSPAPSAPRSRWELYGAIPAALTSHAAATL